MKHCLIIFCLFLITTVYAGEYLVAIDNLNENRKDFTVIEKVDNHFIILADDNDIASIKERNYTYRILDNNPRENEYYVVSPIGENPYTPDRNLYINETVFARYGDVLDVYDYCLIMRGAAEKLQQIPGYNIKLDYINFNPVRYAVRQKVRAKKQPVQPDPLIEEMIEAVSIDTCERLLRQLTGRIPVTLTEEGDTISMYSRYCGNKETNKGILVPWLKKKFLEYGCDSVYELPLLTTKYDAPAVVGIRIGKKNPTLEKFCVIGGHPDNVLNSGDCMGRIYGANDNASGIVGPLETCRVMRDYTFENTILFCAFNAEERGLHGSEALAKYWKDNDFEIIGGVISYDMIGCAPEGGYRVSFCYYTEISGSKEFGDRIEEIVGIYNTYDIRISGTDDYVSTDCSSFWREGLISVGAFASSGSPDIHTLGDSIGPWLNFEHLAKVTQTGLTIIADYAVPIAQTSVQNDLSPKMNNNELTIQYTSDRQIIISVKKDSKNSPRSLHIYNLSGRLIKTLTLKESKNGSYFAVWNGRNDRGNPVVRGLYVLKYKTDTENMFKKITLM